MASASTAKAKGLAQAERRLARLSASRLAAMRGEKTPLTVREWLRFALRTLGILLGLLVSVPLHYIYRVFAYGSPFPMLFLRYTAWVVGARVQVRGTPLRRDVFFIANHVSWVDILALAGATGTAFVAKYELSQVPVIGWLCRLNRTVFVKRENRMDVAQQINALKEALADNWSVTVFPEGTTTDGKSLLPFKSSMLSVLEPPPPGVLVQPVVLDYGEVSEFIGWIGEEDGLNTPLRVIARNGSFRLRIPYLEPFRPAESPGRTPLAQNHRDATAEDLARPRDDPLRSHRKPR